MLKPAGNPVIWLISKQDILLQAFEDVFIAPTNLKHFTGISETVTHLDAQTDTLISPDLILLDATTNPDIIIVWQQLCQTKFKLPRPILLAIIAKPEARQPSLIAGADDYLLLPLLPDEIRKRLEFYLHPNSPAILPEQSQLQAMQNAFMVLAVRLISGRLDLNTALSLTLELIMPLLDASDGDIWLFAENAAGLKLASSLSSSFTSQRQDQRLEDTGLIGWVATHHRPLNVLLADKDPRFDPEVDTFNKQTDYSLLATPLRHHETTIGVLAFYKKQGKSFTNQDMVLVEGIAALTASAIANVRLMVELQEYAEQQRILHQLSHQIGSGLNLETIFKQALFWLVSLTEAKIAMLWLKENLEEITLESLNENDDDKFHLVASLGFNVSQEQPVVATTKSLVGWVFKHGTVAIINEPAADSRLDVSLVKQLNLNLNNLIALPTIYQGQTMGVISILNKTEGIFKEADVPLLTTAVDIIGAAVGNAQLHNRTVRLMKEREQLQREIIQSERLATMGRLTAVLSHEINNPMQAIQGAMMLAQETLNESLITNEDLTQYIGLALKEADRVIELVGRMRQIYRPQTEALAALHLNDILKEVIRMAQKGMKRQKVALQVELTETLPSIAGMANQLHLAFLSLLLNFSETLDLAGGGTIQLRTLPKAAMLQVIISAATNDLSDPLRHSKSDQKAADVDFGMFMSQEIIMAHNGRLQVTRQPNQITCQVDLPAMHQ